MQKITPETEQRLLTVIEKTAEHVVAGESPNAAIIKAAAVVDINEMACQLSIHSKYSRLPHAPQTTG